MQATYDAYAVGVEVMRMRVSSDLGPWNYRVEVDDRSTGLAGLVYGGHQVNTVRGVWADRQPQPLAFFGEGEWRGRTRRTRIDYDRGVAAAQANAPVRYIRQKSLQRPLTSQSP